MVESDLSGSKAAPELVLIICDFYLQELLLDALTRGYSEREDLKNAFGI